MAGENADGTYHDGSRRLQDRFDTRRLADRLAERKVVDVIDEDDRAFIEAADMLFIATADADGRPTCSYKGGDPGFVRVLDERTIAFPTTTATACSCRWATRSSTRRSGCCSSFERQRRLRLDGQASIDEGDLVRSYTGARFVVRVRVRRLFPNCPRYIHRYALIERSRYVPRAGEQAPVPDWKRREWACDVLPAGDPARGDPASPPDPSPSPAPR